MPLIKYKPTNFPAGSPSTLTSTQELSVSWLDLIWGMITVGKFDLLRFLSHSHFNFHEIFFKLHLTFAYLQEHDNHFQKSAAYESLDPTEKGVISYYLGMAMSKVFAYKCLSTPWFYHVSNLSPGLVHYLPGSSRPDLVGEDSIGNWIVVEAKGRSNGFNYKSLQGAKNQTKQIISINGINPKYRIASQSYFNSFLELAIEDPPEANENGEAIKIDRGQALFEYYRPLTSFLSNSKNSRQSPYGTFRVLEIPEYNLTIGLLESILEAQNKGANALLEWRNGIEADIRRKEISKLETEEAHYQDGIFLSLN